MEPLTLWPRIDGSGQLSSRETTRGIRTNTLTASTGKIKIIESIDDRVGGYNFSPTLIASSSRRKQRPLYSPNPIGLSESLFFDRAGSDRCSKGWSRSSMRAPQHKPIGSARIETGQPSLRGRVRCQSHFVAWERRRREPGSNSVIVTIALTRDEGHVVGLGGLQRVRKIFASCLASKPFRGQSSAHIFSGTVRRPQSVVNRPALRYGQTRLCRPRQRRRPKTVHTPTRHSRAGGNPRVHNHTSSHLSPSFAS